MLELGKFCVHRCEQEGTVKEVEDWPTGQSRLSFDRVSVRTLFHLAFIKTLFHLFLLELCSNSELTEQNIIYNPAFCKAL